MGEKSKCAQKYGAIRNTNNELKKNKTKNKTKQTVKGIRHKNERKLIYA